MDASKDRLVQDAPCTQLREGVMYLQMDGQIGEQIVLNALRNGEKNRELDHDLLFLLIHAALYNRDDVSNLTSKYETRTVIACSCLSSNSR